MGLEPGWEWSSFRFIDLLAYRLGFFRVDHSSSSSLISSSSGKEEINSLSGLICLNKGAGGANGFRS